MAKRGRPPRAKAPNLPRAVVPEPVRAQTPAAPHMFKGTHHVVMDNVPVTVLTADPIPAAKHTETVDKSLRDTPVSAPARPAETSRTPEAGYRTFKCYLGHLSYSAQDADKIRCLYCGSVANIVNLTDGAVCLCGHKLSAHGKEGCRACGIMSDGPKGNGEPEARCANFILSV